MKKRRVVAIILLISFVMLPISGIFIHTNHGNFHLEHTWLHLHILVAVIFIICGILHIILNWKALKRYFIAK